MQWQVTSDKLHGSLVAGLWSPVLITCRLSLVTVFYAFVIDVGNTNTVLGVFEKAELRAHWRLTTKREQTPTSTAF